MRNRLALQHCISGYIADFKLQSCYLPELERCVVCMQQTIVAPYIYCSVVLSKTEAALHVPTAPDWMLHGSIHAASDM